MEKGFSIAQAEAASSQHQSQWVNSDRFDENLLNKLYYLPPANGNK